MAAAVFSQAGKPSEISALVREARDAFAEIFSRRDIVEDNQRKVDRLLHAYQCVRNVIEKVRESPSQYVHATQGAISMHSHTVDTNLQELQSLREDIVNANILNRVRRTKQQLDEHETDLQNVWDFIDKRVLPVQMQQQESAHDEYVPVSNVPPNPPRLTLEYSDASSSEGNLRAAVMQEDENKIVGVVAVGMGGVGKTCALRGLARLSEIKEKFTGGVLYIQLGNDASMSTLIDGIGTLVQGTGNPALSERVKTSKGLNEAVDTARAWFKNQTCLLLIDDVWLQKGITTSAVRYVASLLSDDSRVVCTSRTHTLMNACDTKIEFDVLDTYGVKAREMLMTHAAIGLSGALSARNEEAVRGVLGICSGLPVALAVAGESVRRQSRGRMRDVENTWQHVYDRIRENANSITITGGDAESYGPVRWIVETSLDFLRCEHTEFAFDEMFRALCVVAKQQIVPLRMLRNLWGLDNLETTDAAVELLDDVHVVRRVWIGSQVGVQLHDLMVDIAREKASKGKEEKKFWRRLVNNYRFNQELEGSSDVRDEAEEVAASGDEVEAAWDARNRLMQRLRNLCCFGENLEIDSVRSGDMEDDDGHCEWWSMEKDGYIEDNICRALQSAGYEKQLLWLLSQPQWIVSRLFERGISGVERDLEIGKSVARRHDDKDEQLVKHLEMVRRAARMGCTFVIDNDDIREAWFQIHARLLRYARVNDTTRQLVQQMEARAPRPWAQASEGFLQQASSISSDIVSVSGFVYAVHLDDDTLVCCSVYVTTVRITTYSFESGFSETQEKECAEIESDFGVYLYQNRVAMSADSKMVVVGLPDGSIWIWDTQAEQTRRSMDRHNEMATCVAVSDDGRLIASGSRDHTVRIWRSSSGAAVGRALVGHTGPVECVAWSGDGERVASGSFDGSIRVWKLHDEEGEPQLLEGHTHFVRCVAWSADGRRLVSGSDDKSVRVWDTERGEQLGAALEGHSDCVLSVSWSADGTRVASASTDHSVRVWDVCSGALVGQALVGHSNSVFCLHWSANGKRIASGSRDGTARVWEVDEGASEAAPAGAHSAAVQCLALNRQRTRALSGSADGSVRMWQLPSGAAALHAFAAHGAAVRCVAWSADERRFVSGCADGSVRVWDAKSARALTAPLRAHTADVRCVAWSADGTVVASGSDDCSVRLWHVHSAQAAAQPLIGHTSAVLCVAWSADGAHLVSASADNTLRVWSVQREPRVAHVLRGHEDQVECVVWSADCKFVVSGSLDRSVRVWDARSAHALSQPLMHHWRIDEVAANEDASRVVSREWHTGRRRIWNVADGACVASSDDNAWHAAEQQLQRVCSATRSWWSSGNARVTHRGERLATCDTEAERFGELWYSQAAFAHCRIAE